MALLKDAAARNGEAAGFVMRQAEHYSISERHLVRGLRRVCLCLARESGPEAGSRFRAAGNDWGSPRPLIPDR